MSADIPDEWVEKATGAIDRLAVGYADRSSDVLPTNDACARVALAAVADDIRAQTLREAAEAIQAMHPGEVKASVAFLMARAKVPKHYDHRDNLLWHHDDGTRCHIFWSDRAEADGTPWWCTDHQQHVHARASEAKA